MTATALGLFVSLSANKAQASPADEASSTDLQAQRQLNASGVNYGFDAQCGLTLPGSTHIWKPAQSRQEVMSSSMGSRCVIDGDQGSARFRCFCADKPESRVGELELSRIPKLASFSKIHTEMTEEALLDLCQETFHEECGPLAKPLVARCGGSTRSYCEVQMRGDIGAGRYNLFDEFCSCEGKRTWYSSQRLSAGIGGRSLSAQERCDTQLERCLDGQAPSFDSIQMLNHKGYQAQSLRCSRFGRERVDFCELSLERDQTWMRYECNCDGAIRGGGIDKAVTLGAKTMYDECIDQLAYCDEIVDTGGVQDDCDTSSASDEDCESADSSSADDGHDTGDVSGDTIGSGEDDFDPEGPTNTGGEQPGGASQPGAGDVLDSLGCRSAGSGAGGWRAMLGLSFVFMLLCRTKRRRR